VLNSLSITNFATVDQLAMDFGPGLTAVTGETGAGKSILFDALDLLFGARADSGMVRAGSERTELQADISLAHESPARYWLTDTGLDDPDAPQSLLVRRHIMANGGSRAWINGSKVTVSQLRELAELVLDIHGQHAHQALLRATHQRDLLDAFGQLSSHRDAVKSAFRHWQSLLREQQRRTQDGFADQAELDLARYQLEELEQLAPAEDELAKLNQDFLRLSRVDETRADCAYIAQALAAEGGVEDLLGALLRRADALQGADSGLAPISEQLTLAIEAAQDARRESEHAAERMESDPEGLAHISQRLERWEDLARKHRVPAADLPAHWAKLADKVQQAQRDAQGLQELETEIAQAEATYAEAAQALSQARSRSSVDLVEALLKRLPALGLPHARLSIQVQPQATAPAAHGWDQVQFLVSMNPGQEPQPLAKVASGGELARMSLAVAVSAQAAVNIPILLFDEVDVGVGGAIAEAIGEHLADLAQDNQVLCVTHQPQVAALASTHFFVDKQVRDGQTFSRLRELDLEARVEELSRMAGGRQISEQTRAHARAMLGLG
jgi:DNA repair protein RecN (Recombination protein N)